MRDPSTSDMDLTRLLARAGSGDADAGREAFSRVYDELRVLAQRQRARWTGDPTMNATALVHEAYLKLVGRSPLDLRDRGHFFALASRAMRQVLCNYARDRGAEKRGGGREPVSIGALDAADLGQRDGERLDELLDLSAALDRLDAMHPRAVRVVECRFFGGMTVDETAAALEISGRTVKRDWDFAQTWLFARLGPEP